MATSEQRQAMSAAETLAAILDAQLDLVGLLALQPFVQRRPDLMTELETAAEGLIAARQIVFVWRRQLQHDAGGAGRD
jgi:hypothetical protein